MTEKKTSKKKVTKKQISRGKRKDKSAILPQHKKFCDILRTSRDWDVIGSYMKAFPNCKSRQAASSATYKIFSRPEVQAYLNEKQELMEEKVDLTQEDILRDLIELKDMCMGKIKSPVTVSDKDGNIIRKH